VTLGSLRVRQDFLIAEGLLAPYEKESREPPKRRSWRWRGCGNWRRTKWGTRWGLMHKLFGEHGEPFFC